MPALTRPRLSAPVMSAHKPTTSALPLNTVQKKRLLAAQARCQAQGSLLTPLRAEVLGLLIKRGGEIGRAHV